MKKRRKIENNRSSEWVAIDSSPVKPGKLNSAVFFMLCLMPIIATIAYGSVDSWALSLQAISAGIILLLWLADSLFNKEFRFSTNLLQLPLLGLILIGLIQLLPLRNSGISSELLSIPAVSTLSFDSHATRFAVVQLCIYFVFFAAALVFINSHKRLQKIVYVTIIFGSFMAFLGIIQSLTGNNSIYGLRYTAAAIPFASFVNRHHFAALMEMTIGLTLSLLYGNATKKDKRLLLIIAVVLMGSALFLTGSRGGILSFLGVVGFVTILHLTVKESNEFEPETASKTSISSRTIALIGASALLVVLLIGAVLFIGGDNSLMRGVGITEQADFSTGRTHFWQTALQIIAANPIIGTGLDTFGFAFTRYDTWNGTLRVEQTHNDYLQILSDAGILGFACVAVFIFLLFKQGLNAVNRIQDKFFRGLAIGALAGCLGILAHSFVDFPLRTPSNPLFFLILVTLATLGYRKVKQS